MRHCFCKKLKVGPRISAADFVVFQQRSLTMACSTNAIFLSELQTHLDANHFQGILTPQRNNFEQCFTIDIYRDESQYIGV